MVTGLADRVDRLDKSLIGSLWQFAGSVAPVGFLFCDGSAVSRDTYAALFAVIGVACGAGNGTTTFNLPDTRGMFLRGLDRGRGVDTGRVLGSSQLGSTARPSTGLTVGLAVGATIDGSGNHVHSQGCTFFYGSNSIERRSSCAPANTGYAGSHSHTVTGGDAETRPRNIAVNYIIRYMGG